MGEFAIGQPVPRFEDPQLNAGGRMLEIEFPNGVSAKIPRLPIEIGNHDFALQRQAPTLGQHTAEILAELGIAPSEIAALGKRGIVTAGDRS